MGKSYTRNGYVELYQVYQLGQELMGAEGGAILLVEMLLHRRVETDEHGDNDFYTNARYVTWQAFQCKKLGGDTMIVTHMDLCYYWDMQYVSSIFDALTSTWLCMLLLSGCVEKPYENVTMPTPKNYACMKQK